MEKNHHEKDYWELLDGLNHCEKGSNTEFGIYQKLAELSDKEIKELDDEPHTDVVIPETGELLGWNPTFLDDFAGPMDNLAHIYMERDEYAKALPLLEKILPIYRTLEIYNPDYTYQRYYAMKAMVDCLNKLGQTNMAILYGYELKHLQRDVLEAREEAASSEDAKEKYRSYLVEAGVKYNKQ